MYVFFCVGLRTNLFLRVVLVERDNIQTSTGGQCPRWLRCSQNFGFRNVWFVDTSGQNINTYGETCSPIYVDCKLRRTSCRRTNTYSWTNTSLMVLQLKKLLDAVVCRGVLATFALAQIHIITKTRCRSRTHVLFQCPMGATS